MHRIPFPSSSRIKGCDLRSKRGFTIMEVLLATFVMVMALSTSLIVLQKGLRSVDTARNTTIANQILQSLTEDLRTRPWSHIIDTTRTSNITNESLSAFDLDQVNRPLYNSFIPAQSAATAAAVLSRYTFSRSVVDVAGTSSTMKAITLTARWTGIDGRSHMIQTTSYYAQFGLYAYYSS